MARENNYLIQAAQAKARFLTYDPEKLIQKLHLPADADWLYATMLSTPYRIHRATGDIFRQEGPSWKEAGYEEIMTLLDLVCDSREDRFLTHRFKSMRDFGNQFHWELLEGKDPWAEKFQAEPQNLHRACEALHGTPLPQGDVAYAIELFDGLEIALQLWFGDEEFPPNLRFLWDENARMYLKYETMYFAKGLLLQRINAFFD